MKGIESGCGVGAADCAAAVGVNVGSGVPLGTGVMVGAAVWVGGGVAVEAGVGFPVAAGAGNPLHEAKVIVISAMRSLCRVMRRL
jgi:hypothetical protein